MKKSGDRVNLECDIIGKYVEKMLLNQNEKSDKKGITMDFLCEKGFI
jgi:riboflavin synthase